MARLSTTIPPYTTIGLVVARVVSEEMRRLRSNMASHDHERRHTFCCSPLSRVNKRLSSTSCGVDCPFFGEVSSTKTRMLSLLRTSISEV